MRETAEVSFANSIRTEMTGFLHRIQPGKRVMTQELADDPMCQTGWLDVRTNAAENMVAVGRLDSDDSLGHSQVQ